MLTVTVLKKVERTQKTKGARKPFENYGWLPITKSHFETNDAIRKKRLGRLKSVMTELPIINSWAIYLLARTHL